MAASNGTSAPRFDAARENLPMAVDWPARFEVVEGQVNIGVVVPRTRRWSHTSSSGPNDSYATTRQTSAEISRRACSFSMAAGTKRGPHRRDEGGA